MNQDKRDDGPEQNGRAHALEAGSAGERPESMMRRDALRVLGAGALGTVTLLATSAEAQNAAAPRARAPVPGTAAPTLGVETTSLTVSGDSQLQGLSLKRAGVAADIKLTIKARGSGTASVPWRIAVDGREIGSGANQVSGGASFTASATWTATSGVHTFTGMVDPDNTLKELADQRKDNTRQITAEFDEWVTRGDQIFEAVLRAVHSWQREAHFANVIVNGPTATGAAGCLVGPDLEPLIQQSPQVRSAAGISLTIRDRFAKVVSAKWKAWQSGVTVPGLPWYPPFAAVPGPRGTPTPNVPCPLAACVSAKLTEMSTAGPLKTALLGELKEVTTSANAQKVIDAFATTLSARFTAWLGVVVVKNVIGSGPVPTYAPPYVPVGPVVKGSIAPTGPHLNDQPF